MATEAGPVVRVVSPCVRNCCLDGDVCIGCGRTIDEIMAWSSAADSERKLILGRAEARRRQRQEEMRQLPG